MLAELCGVPLHQGAAHQRLIYVDDGRVVPDGEPGDHGGDGDAGGAGVADVADISDIRILKGKLHYT